VTTGDRVRCEFGEVGEESDVGRVRDDWRRVTGVSGEVKLAGALQLGEEENT
jgi:hypothetical protein